MARLLPPALSEQLAKALAELGVKWYWSESVTSVAQSEVGAVIGTNNGLALPVDLVLSAIGLRPNIVVAEEAGLSCEVGISVDQNLQTSHSDVYALGDCASVSGVNMQYVLPLMACARALAKTLSGEPTAVSYPVMPVVVKTPACPTVVAMPPLLTANLAKVGAQWQISGEGVNLRANLLDSEGSPIGFALMGDTVKEKVSLAKSLPDWLPVV
jgi:rubredoxin-NAD+ reductase